MLLLFSTTDIHAFITFPFFFFFSKGIFHLGVLISITHTSVYMSFTEWECVCFSSFVECNFEIMTFNVYSKYFITERDRLKFCC